MVASRQVHVKQVIAAPLRAHESRLIYKVHLDPADQGRIRDGAASLRILSGSTAVQSTGSTIQFDPADSLL